MLLRHLQLRAPVHIAWNVKWRILEKFLYSLYTIQNGHSRRHNSMEHHPITSIVGVLCFAALMAAGGLALFTLSACVMDSSCSVAGPISAGMNSVSGSRMYSYMSLRKSAYPGTAIYIGNPAYVYFRRLYGAQHRHDKFRARWFATLHR